MGNRVSKKATSPKHGAAELKGVTDIQLLHTTGRDLLDLENKLAKTRTDRDSLEQELGTVRTWLDRVEAGNAELLEALKDARNKTSVLTSELELKKQRVLALESELESKEKLFTESQFSLPATNSLPPLPCSPTQVDSEKDRIISKCQNEIAELKLELRKKDRLSRKEMRQHSRQLSLAAEAEIVKEWQSDHTSMLDADDVATIDQSIEVLFRTHKAALDRADKLVSVLSELNTLQVEEIEQQQKEWQRQRSIRHEDLKLFDILQESKDVVIDLSLCDMKKDETDAKLDPILKGGANDLDILKLPVEISAKKPIRTGNVAKQLTPLIV